MWPFKRKKKRRVILVDFNGELTVREAKQLGQHLIAYRHESLCRFVILKPDGTTEGISYVKGWMEVDPA